MSSLYSEDSTRDKTVSSLALSATTVNFAWLADTRSKDVKIDSDFQLKKKTYFFRGLVMFGLLAICAICGTLIFFLLRMVEERLFESEYESIASQVITSSKTGLNKRSLGPRTMATRIGTLFDNEIYWPYVSVDGYYNIANRIKTLVHIKSLEFYPIVKHEEVSSFEDFAYDYFLSDPYVAPGAGITDIGKGIYAIDETTGSKYFDRSGNTTYGSPYKIIAPLLQSGEYKLDDGSLPPYMFNYHSAQNLGSALDHIINCVSNSSFDDSTILNDCGTISDLFEDDDNAISVITQPIFIANTTDLVGFVNSEISWKDILRDIVPDSVDGLDCIIRTEASVSSYQIQNGIALYKGARDIHDSNFNSYRKEGAMLNYELTTAATTTYLLQVYPRQAFVETYLSDTPLYAACGAVALIVLTSAIFFLYDYAIKSEVIAKQAVLDTKRKFVQFIAREVRTPLKTVGIGLGLLKLEINNLVELIMNNPNQILNVCGEQVNDWIQLAHDAIGNSESAIMGLDDLLNHEKMELGIIQFDYKAIDIWDLLRKTFNMFKIHASQKKIQYVLQIERWDEGIPRELKNAFDCLRVVGDINRLAQVLRILLSNALKYTPESGEVVFAAEYLPEGMNRTVLEVPSMYKPLVEMPRAGSVRISVHDSGPGLSRQMMRLIFGKALATLDTRSENIEGDDGTRIQGTEKVAGLGLLVSKGIIREHGGRITGSSFGQYRGTSFTVELPLFVYPLGLEDDCFNVEVIDSAPYRQIPNRDSECPGDLIEEPEKNLFSDSVRVVVASSRAQEITELSFLLREEGFIFYDVNNSQACFDLFLEKLETPTVLLLDENIPGMKAVDMVKTIRSKWPMFLKVIALVDNDYAALDYEEKENEEFENLKLVVDAIIKRPFDFVVIRDHIHRFWIKSSRWSKRSLNSSEHKKPSLRQLTQLKTDRRKRACMNELRENVQNTIMSLSVAHRPGTEAASSQSKSVSSLTNDTPSIGPTVNVPLGEEQI